MPPSSHSLACAGREIHCTDWQPDGGGVARGTVVAWHGLARTGRDMDALAAHLSARGWRVLCPDTLGHGQSQWARHPKDEYCLAFHARLARELLAQLGIERCHWVGTSMGGAIGMVGASGYFEPELKRRIQSLVLDDSAPQLAPPAIERLMASASPPPAFDTVTEPEACLPDGRVTTHPDPAIVAQFTHYPDDYLLWHHYDALQVPVLLLRGAESNLVRRETAEQMRTRGPGVRGGFEWVEVPAREHAPALNVPNQLALVSGFIERVEQAGGSATI